MQLLSESFYEQTMSVHVRQNTKILEMLTCIKEKNKRTASEGKRSSVEYQTFKCLHADIDKADAEVITLPLGSS